MQMNMISILGKLDRMLGMNESGSGYGSVSLNQSFLENKKWRLRLKLVKELRLWVSYNLKNSQKSREYKERKAMQYTTEHLALGKMIFPLENEDPLFTKKEYEDVSMQEQLKIGKYREFQDLVKMKLNIVITKDVSRELNVTWNEIFRMIKDKNLDHLRKLQNRLTGGQTCELGKASVEITNKMIGLVLRYQCLGAFEDNFHASIPQEWSTDLEDFTECFASPLNHKLGSYYSMFDDDKEFGSKGSFFGYIQENNGILPNGKYEMNPPWMNAMYEKLQTIVDSSIKAERIITVILIGPNWKETLWIPGTDSVLRNLPDPYWINSYSIHAIVSYIHDINQQTFQQKTLIWVFSNDAVPDAICNLLKSTKD